MIGLLSASLIASVIIFLFFDLKTSQHSPASTWSQSIRQTQSEQIDSLLSAQNTAYTESDTNEWAAQTLSSPNKQGAFRSVSDVISSGLTEQEIALYDENPVSRIDSDLQNNPNLISSALQQVKQLGWSNSRAYLLALISGLDEQQKQQAALELLTSQRSIDKQAGLSLIMELEDVPSKSQAVENILISEPDSETVENLLAHLKVDDELKSTPNVNSALQQLYQTHTDEHIQALALQAMTPDKVDDNMYQDMVSLITNNHEDNTMAGLNTLNTWLVNNVASLSSAQKADITAKASYVADSPNYSIDTRMKALELMKNAQ
jgi:hypothetical protein